MASATLTDTEAQDALFSALKVYPEDDEHLLSWIETVTGQRIPYNPVCEDHQTAGQLICDFFFHRTSDAVAMAARSTGKTAGLSALHTANSFHKENFLTTHFGATENQAHRAYSEYKKTIEGPLVKDNLLDVHVKESIWKNGAILEILPGTERQTQGPHSHIATYDELESGSFQPFENAKSVPMEYRIQGRRYPGQFLACSTRNSSYGLMQKALDDAEESTYTKTYIWCVFESMEPCNGKEGPSCIGQECPLWKWCGPCECGKSSDLIPEEHGKVVHAEGWRSLSDILALRDRLDDDTWEAQHLCAKPYAKSLIYSNFSKEKNVSHDAKFIPGAGPIYVWYDWGFSEDTYILLVQFRDNKFYVFDEIVDNHQSEQFYVRETMRRITLLDDYIGPTYEKWIEYWDGKFPDNFDWPEMPYAMGDPKAVQLRFEFKEHGFSCAEPKRIQHSIKSGQDVLRAAISTGTGNVRLVLNPTCIKTIECLEKYRAKELDDGSFLDDPDQSPSNHRFSHGCDACRYGVWGNRLVLGLVTATSEE